MEGAPARLDAWPTLFFFPAITLQRGFSSTVAALPCAAPGAAVCSAPSMPLTDTELLQRFDGATLAVTSTVRNHAKSKVHHGSGGTSICVLPPPKGWAKHTCHLRLADGRRFRVELMGFRAPEMASVLRMFVERPKCFSAI
jgi:hypothetical protein